MHLWLQWYYSTSNEMASLSSISLLSSLSLSSSSLPLVLLLLSLLLLPFQTMDDICNKNNYSYQLDVSLTQHTYLLPYHTNNQYSNKSYLTHRNGWSERVGYQESIEGTLNKEGREMSYESYTTKWEFRGNVQIYFVTLVANEPGYFPRKTFGRRDRTLDYFCCDSLAHASR